MTHQATILKSAFLGLSLLGLTACQHTDVARPSPYETTMRNSVQMIRLPFEIRAEEDGTDTPSSATYAQIHAFLKSANVGYGDTLMLDAGAATPGRTAAVEAFIRSQGYTYGGTGALGAMPRDGSVMLYVERYVVTTPNCGEWKAETSNNQRNNPSGYLGCSNTANLGLMIANPRDLVAGQAGKGLTSEAVKPLIVTIEGKQQTSGGGLPGDIGGKKK